MDRKPYSWSRTTKCLREGKLKDIYRLFIIPMLRLKPPGYEYHAWLEEIFCVKQRRINKYKVIKLIQVPVTGYRIPVGRIVWIRHDTKFPNRYDMEIQSPVQEKPKLFILNKRMWYKYKHNLELMADDS